MRQNKNLFGSQLENREINTMKFVLIEKSDNVAEDITLKSVMTTDTAKDELLKFSGNSFLIMKKGFSKIGYGIGSYTSEKPVHNSGIDKNSYEKRLYYWERCER